MASLPNSHSGTSILAEGRSSSATEMLIRRRSAAPDTLVAPGPSRDEIDRIMGIALSVPDHGRLSPWRILLIADEAKARWLDALSMLAEQQPDAAKARVGVRKLATAPLVAAVISSPIAGHKVPEWEQMLSAGAVAMNMLNGVASLGYGANWLTGWHAYDPHALGLLGIAPSERIAGIILIGSVAAPTNERERGAVADVVSWLAV
jgi:nitroreductase